MLVCGDAKAKRADAAETFREKPDQRREASRPDHSVGAVNALLGMSADDAKRRGCRVPYADRRLALQNVFAQAIWDPDEDGNQDEEARAHAVAEEQRRIEDFFEREVTDDWLLDKLGPGEECASIFEYKPKGLRTLCRRHVHIDDRQEADFNQMRKRLRGYIRQHLYIRGQLEPFFKKPTAGAIKSITASAVSLFDFGSDVAATCMMFAQLEVYAEKFAQQRGCNTNRGGATGINRDDGVYHAADPEAARSTRLANFRQARVVDARPAPRSRVVLHVAHVASGDCLRAVGANPTEVFRPEHPQQLTADLARSVR